MYEKIFLNDVKNLFVSLAKLSCTPYKIILLALRDNLISLIRLSCKLQKVVHSISEKLKPPDKSGGFVLAINKKSR